MAALIFPLTLALYAASATLYFSHLSSGNEALVRAARYSLIAAFCAHTLDIGALCMTGLPPLSGTREALSFAAWFMMAVYLGLSLRYRIPVVGAVILPITLVFEVAARVAPAARSGPHIASRLFELHIGLATAGVAIFAVAAGDAVVFLWAERQLKTRRVGQAGRRAPPLETLDRINRACVFVGFPLFSIAMVMGTLLAMRLPDGGTHRLLQPEYLLSALTWALYAALLTLRMTAGWRGRRAALVTLAGFTAAACVVVIYYANSFHPTA